jgi:hypothetical protein
MRLIRSKFKKWLRAKPAESVVGEQRDCLSCPLALFYAETSGGCEVVISSHRRGYGYAIDRGDGERSLPAWADAFAFSVDSDGMGKITAGRALEVLEKC